MLTIHYDTYIKDNLVYDASQEYLIIYKKHYFSVYDMELQDIKPIHIVQCMNTTKKYSNSRQRRVYYQLHKIFESALANDYITKNPVEQVKVPAKIKKNIQYFKSNEIAVFLSELETSSDCRMFALMLYTGLRRGELLALHWDNIDTDSGYINVCQTVVRCDGGQKIEDTTKGRKDRLIPITLDISYILDLIRTQDSDNGFLFKGMNKDAPMCLTSFNSHYKRYFEHLQNQHSDLQYLSSHKLRHTFATYILRNGGDIRTLMALLGHSNIETTQIYIHSDFEQCRKACENLKF